MKRMLLLLGLSLAAIPLTGCGQSKLETGYAYTPLGDSSTKRRSYYADPFSPEAQVAQNEGQADIARRQVVPGQ